MVRRCLLVFSAVMMLIVTGGRLYGQSGATGTILGTVTDSSGAIVPNVSVTVTNKETNQTFKTATNSAGDYNAPSLQPGTYTVNGPDEGL